MSTPITILVGTMTGNAELVSGEIELTLQDAGFAPTIVPMDEADLALFDRPGTFLIVCSTFGNGDVPDNAQALFKALKEQRPNLSGSVYGLVALGDMTYKATFCNGGKQFDALFAELGATRIGEPLYHDASSGTLAEDVACEWASQWIATDLAPALAA